ncbi:hypothetical protein NBRC10512_001700 [Rhodotorula toruloides]|uniref:RHTO0S07e00364g1_1 n=2 Tax=Rhodotorula toruloides TaxID=5286 RepID=A0A061B4H3_RHOTO|nr:uncharacterized protein RHTO_02679 [Rhodotorula toruloides NP11]EMS24953.1 hypothetical protein RHTO_02679 [Rhodotorula toruloides NP11]CDR42521.1 RHTO0S07e00364g1_1 [Rhodotorula toruloides]
MHSLRSSVLRRSLTPSLRSYATGPKPSSTDLPVAPPHNSLPFAAPSAFEDKDTTKGSGLGQVKMPDMERVERGSLRAEEEVGRVPTAPDTYRTSSSSPDSDSLPSNPMPSISTAAHPSTMPGGGPISNVTGEDVLADSETSSSADGGHGQGKGKDSRDRPLNEQEKQGLYVLAGIVVGGLGLSTITAPRRKHE